MSPRKGKDPLKPGSKAFEQRQARWKHNALFGSLGMAKSLCINVHQSSSTTAEAKATAVEIENLLYLLGDQLKTRIDQ